MIGYLKSYLEKGITKAKLKLQLARKQHWCIIQDRKTFGHFWDLDNVHGLSVFGYDYRMVLFLS